GGRDLAKGPAVGVAGLEVEGIGLAGAAVHPEEDAGPAALRVGGCFVGQGLDPAGVGRAEHARRTQLHQLTPGDLRSRHGNLALLRSTSPSPAPPPFILSSHSLFTL